MDSHRQKLALQRARATGMGAASLTFEGRRIAFDRRGNYPRHTHEWAWTRALAPLPVSPLRKAHTVSPWVRQMHFFCVCGAATSLEEGARQKKSLPVCKKNPHQTNHVVQHLQKK